MSVPVRKRSAAVAILLIVPAATGCSALGDVTSRVFEVHGDDTGIPRGHGDDATLGAKRPHLAEWRKRGR